MCCCLKDVVFRDVRPIVKYLLVLFTTRMYVTGVSKWYRQSFIIIEDEYSQICEQSSIYMPNAERLFFLSCLVCSDRRAEHHMTDACNGKECIGCSRV